MNSSGKLVALEIASELPDLWTRYPDGLTIRNLADEMKLPYHTAHAAAVWLGDSKHAKWTVRPDRTAPLLVPVGWTAPAYDLTDRQKAIHDQLVKMSNRHGHATTSFRSLAISSGTSPGSINAHLEALQRKGYVAIHELGNSTGQPTIFAVNPAGGPL